MLEPSPSALASVLRPFATSVFAHVRRLAAERQAGQVPLTQPAKIMDDSLNETLDRIRGDSVDSGWWQGLLDRFGQKYIAPDFLRRPALREWLAEESVAVDLKSIATWRIMATSQDEAATRDRLAQSYSNRTGEALYLAAHPIDVVVAILIGGHLAAIPPDQRAVAGVLQTGFSRIDERFDRLNEALSPFTDPFTRQAHTERAAKELDRIVTFRALDPARSRSDVQKLHDRLASGDLVAADTVVKHRVRYWTARLCASDGETLDVARDLGKRIQDDEPNKDLTIVDALIRETDGDSDGAIQLLRDRDDPDSRTALFGVLARSRDSGTALDAFADRMDAADASFFTPVGWRNWAVCMAEVGSWQEAADRLARIDGTWSEAPVLAFVEGFINSQLLLPDERRSATGDPRLYGGISPNQGERAEVAHARATSCFELAQSGLQDLDDTRFKRFIADWCWWLRLMDPNDENARSACVEIRENLESKAPDVRLVPFASAFGVSFNRESLHRHLFGREKLGGLDDDELRAECLLFLTAMNSGGRGAREFLDYLETRQARLARVMPDSLLKAARVDALVTDNQVEKARALLAETRSGLDEAEVIRLSTMIDAHEGIDVRSELEQAYQKTRDIVDLHNLVEYLKQSNDRGALLPLLEELIEKQRTVANLMDLVVCLSGRPFFDHRQIVEILDINLDLVEQSPNLKMAKALSLFNVGRFSDAGTLNDQLLSVDHHAADHRVNALALDIKIAIATGDWERLPAIVEREWPRRNEHDAEVLLTLARISSHQGRNPNRALALAKLAGGEGTR